MPAPRGQRLRAPPADPSMRLLTQALSDARAPVMWFADEHIDTLTAVAAREGLQLASNRFDVAQAARQAGIVSHFCDGNPPLTGCNSVVYRISKEKALVHHLINHAATHLPDGAQLWLCGGKQEGILTYLEKTASVFGPLVSESRGEGATRLACFRRDASLRGLLDDRDYQTLRPTVTEGDLAWFSKPGQFGWEKTDEGSRMLASHLDTASPLGTTLDLGCGYGYLSLHAVRAGATRVIATDNNAAAILSCRHNLALTGIPAEVIADDCGAALDTRVDTVICNPPFHQGFSTRGDLTDRFLQAAHRLLKPEGQALFVVNQFIPMEQKAASLFASLSLLERDRSFKVFRLSAPKGTGAGGSATRA
jgi:16S rRNA (guanine1207-N2)-methyltransferase